MEEDGKAIRVKNIFEQISGGNITHQATPDVVESSIFVPGSISSLPIDEPKVVEPEYETGVGEQEDVSLDFAPGQSVEDKRISGSGSIKIHGKDRAADPAVIPKSEGEFYHNTLYTYNNTEEHMETIRDQSSGRRFISTGVTIDTLSTNTSDIDYKFSSSGDFEALGAGKSLSFDKIQIQKIIIRLKTSGDKLRLRAW